MDVIGRMLANPPSVEKSTAQWAIFSTLTSRVHVEQRERGQFYALWADIDKTNGMTFDEIVERANGCLLDFLAYTTSSATEKKQKARIIVPLAGPVDGKTFVHLQKILNDKLQENGVTPDRATERAGQVCYLPNRGKFYLFHIEKSSGPMPADAWAGEIQAETERERAAETARKQRMERAKAKARQRMQTGCKSPIDAYNAEFSVEMMLDAYGYIRRERRWLSPNSSSKTPGVSLTPDGKKWMSAHASDANIGTPTVNGTMGDAFDLFIWYEHHGDRAAAIKAAAEMFGLRSERQHQRPEDPPAWVDEVPPMSGYDAGPEDGQTDEGIQRDANTTADSGCPLDCFALNGLAGDMEKQMLDDKFVMGQMAILGQATVFYARHNVGKTLIGLHLLIEKIKSGELNPADLYYINADDNHKGLVYKLKLAERWGFKMLAPGYKGNGSGPGFKSEMLPVLIDKMVATNTASGKIIVLDTLKKFTDLMDKKKSSSFGECKRKFVSHGGTTVSYAHVNKHKGDDNKVVYAGTTDMVDDADCAYTLDIFAEDPATLLRTVRFENIKSRGDSVREAFYSYDAREAIPYQDRLASVVEVGAEDRERAQRQMIAEKNRKEIQAILQCIRQGVTGKTELIKSAMELSGSTKKKIASVLERHAGRKVDKFQFWHVKVGERNTHQFMENWNVVGF
ncbi:hypothetical protein [Desulfosarcina ovata]|nr:hypothetical protein [Desulfosarcina ovata]